MENVCRVCEQCREVMVRVFVCGDHHGNYTPPSGKAKNGTWTEHTGGHDDVMCLPCVLKRGIGADE